MKRSTTMNAEHCQNLIIGSGVAGKILAWTLASQRQKTVVVERAMVGGSCPNVACLPSKNVIYSAKAVSLVHPTKGLGVVTGPLRVDMAGVARRKWQMVNELVEVHLGKFRESGAELIMTSRRSPSLSSNSPSKLGKWPVVRAAACSGWSSTKATSPAVF